MQIVRESMALHEALKRLRADGERLALVPTMGALHDGHLALVAEARRRADKVLATIFVNPTQFNDPADLRRYPRTEAEDIARLERAECDLVWLPSVGNIYPDGFATTVSVRGITERWEGEHRPGHFDGVATVVAKLLLAAMPDIAIFGEKDWQQLAVIRRMSLDLGLPVEIVGHETVREADGLAMSSRNALLSSAERAQAPRLHSALTLASSRIGGGENVDAALDAARNAIAAAGFGRIDYFAYVDGETLEPLSERSAGGRLVAAAFLGKIRLIDNVRVD
ncbi:pantoate--beta-alanine ligase [Sphingomonas sp. HDW15A]|uniref:pantoate--beta-alanine ligase n=1 Tax=Sphingomonas sp. HDW15A TaxID=2714942 RepID=UPI00140DCFD9|nr:pantoate--beta-alanine ligase [Sphingomonas sp. HDW15A]QIK95209.1 pantoate--beta-alanine ligase [Sphingomonas sp. HDW15A]